MSFQVCFISQMNFDFEENGGKKTLLANPKRQCDVSQWEKHDCRAYNKKNGDYYEYLGLFHFSNKL